MVEPKTKIITAEVHTWIADWLEAARKRGTTKTWNVNEALTRYIYSQQRKKPVAKSV
jgi:hypothetical protein